MCDLDINAMKNDRYHGRMKELVKGRDELHHLNII